MAKYGEKVALVGIQRQKGYLYYVDQEGDVSRSKIVRRTKNPPVLELPALEE